MAQHNGGFLPGIILLTLCYYHRGTRLNAMKRFYLQPMILPNVLTFFSLTGGCSDRLDAFRFFFKHTCLQFNAPQICAVRISGVI